MVGKAVIAGDKPVLPEVFLNSAQEIGFGKTLRKEGGCAASPEWVSNRRLTLWLFFDCLLEYFRVSHLYFFFPADYNKLSLIFHPLGSFVAQVGISIQLPLSFFPDFSQIRSFRTELTSSALVLFLPLLVSQCLNL